MLCNKCYGMLSEKEFYKKLADFIKLKRKNLKLTNEKISELTNIDLSKVSLLQNNKQGCSAYTLYKLLYSLNINIFADNLNIDNDKLNKYTITLQEILDYLNCLKNK